MIGKTNVISQIGAGDGTSATLTIVNKTGSTINKGDKVWLNEDVRTADTNFLLGSYANNTTKCGVISPNGLCAVADSKLYLIEDDVSSYVKSAGGFVYIRYNGPYVISYNGPSGTASQILSSNDIVSLDGGYRYIENSDGLFVKNKGTKVYKFDLTTGDLLQTWDYGDYINPDNMGAYYQYGNSIIVRGYKYELNSDGTITGATAVEGLSTLNDMFLTKDKNYIICLYGSIIKVFKIIDDTHVEELPESNLPEDLRDLTGYSNFVYNANNDIITLTKNYSASKEHMVIKFNDGKLEKLSVTLPFNGENEGITVGSDIYSYLFGPITFSDDMSRAIITLSLGSYSGASATQVVINFTGTTGYIAVPYKTYAVNEDSITGIARENADNGATLEVNVAQNVVDE
ncbi:MAG: hypothetical protein E7016_04045 [Alphaproteobacteria bacterium]|nr:hypothetical protein [Alphaproteobacteria bacterium]